MTVFIEGISRPLAVNGGYGMVLIQWSCDRHVISPATSVATKIGNSFFLKVVITLSLSP